MAPSSRSLLSRLLGNLRREDVLEQVACELRAELVRLQAKLLDTEQLVARLDAIEATAAETI